jgi:hypothetical protein
MISSYTKFVTASKNDVLFYLYTKQTYQIGDKTTATLKKTNENQSSLIIFDILKSSIFSLSDTALSKYIVGLILKSLHFTDSMYE